MPPPSTDGGYYIICRFHNPVGRWLAAAAVYATTNLGRFVGAIHESPVYRVVKQFGVGLKVVKPYQAYETTFGGKRQRGGASEPIKKRSSTYYSVLMF